MRVRTRIKICGLREQNHAFAAAQAGADAVGLVFHPKSVRAVTSEQARSVIQGLPAFMATVALFMDAKPDVVAQVIRDVRPTMLQFHGTELPDYCRSFGLPYLKAIPMGAEVDCAAYARDFADASGLLLDSHAPGRAGGSGERFDWSQPLPKDGPPLIVAGGLNPENVGEAINNMRPYGVDVSSGVETSPGVKDNALIRAFCVAVNAARTDERAVTNEY